MISAIETGQDIRLSGKNGERYQGYIYEEKNSTSSLSGGAIVCLSNSQFTGSDWQHRMNSIYNTTDIQEALKHFRERDDISHIILIPHTNLPDGNTDHVDNLIRNYLHG